MKAVHLKNYKRFTELTIADLPDTAKLVVLVGPNGSGKSSVFDSFLLKAKAAVNNQRLSGDTEQYYEKVGQSRTTHDIATRVDIEFTQPLRAGWTGSLRSRCGRRTEMNRTFTSSNCGRRGRQIRSPASLGSSILTNPSQRTISRWYGQRVAGPGSGCCGRHDDRKVPERIPTRLAEGHGRPILSPTPFSAGLR